PILEHTVRMRLTPVGNIRRAGRESPLVYYLGTVMLIIASLGGALLFKAYADGAREWLLGAAGILALIASSQVALELVNWMTQLLVTPHPLPRMDFSLGIPSTSHALVVVPSLLTSASDLAGLAEALEVRFLASRDHNLHFGLLTDFPDAEQEVMPGDAALLRLARGSIEELNHEYADASPGAGHTSEETHEGHGQGPFFLFHRPRRWNPQ